MSRRRLQAVLALGILGVVLSAAPPARADEALTVVSTDVSAYPEIRMVIAAPDRLGDQVLDDRAVRVVEGDTTLPVRIQALPAAELEVALVIDTSGSMVRSPLVAAKAAAKSFLGQLPPAVAVSVVGFGASPTVLSPRSTDRVAQVAAIDAMTAGGQTALYDALGTALTQLPGTGGRRMVVLLTDGGDTASAASLEATAAAFVAARVPLFVVELRTSESNPEALGRLTSAAAGRVVQASDPAALSGAFDTVARQLVRQHALTYRSQASGSIDVDVVLDAVGVRASARPHLDLPEAARLPSPRSGPIPGAAGGSSAIGGWSLVVGAGLWGGALLALLLGYVTSHVPRARGLGARDRRTRLSDAAGWAESVGDSVLRRRGGARVDQLLEVAGLEMRSGELLSGVAAAAIATLAIGWLLVGPVLGLVLALLVPVAARVGLGWLAGRRRDRFSRQVTETLQILAGSLRAGHGLAQGIETVAREAESPTAEEFRRLTIETRLGRDFVEALCALAERVGSSDLLWVAQAVEIQREVGGDLAEILDTVADTIRDRTRIRLQVSALSAEGRVSAWVLMALPFGLAGFMSMTNPTYLRPLVQTGTGLVIVSVGAALLVVGGLWLRRIVKPIF